MLTNFSAMLIWVDSIVFHGVYPFNSCQRVPIVGGITSSSEMLKLALNVSQ